MNLLDPLTRVLLLATVIGKRDHFTTRGSCQSQFGNINSRDRPTFCSHHELPVARNSSRLAIPQWNSGDAYSNLAHGPTAIFFGRRLSHWTLPAPPLSRERSLNSVSAVAALIALRADLIPIRGEPLLGFCFFGVGGHAGRPNAVTSNKCRYCVCKPSDDDDDDYRPRLKWQVCHRPRGR